MARLPRLHIDGGFYYVTLRAYRGHPLFPRRCDRWFFEQVVAEAVARTSIQIHAFCWMRGYVRFLVRVAQQPLSEFVQRLASRYVRSIRSRQGRVGRLFEPRHNALLFDPQRYFLPLLRAIHLEPMRFESGAMLHEFRWSSHRAYLGENDRPWLCTAFGLRLFHRDPQRARARYRELMLSADPIDADPDSFSAHRHDPRVLGDTRFLEQHLTQELDRRPQNRALTELVEELCHAERITLDALRSRCQSRVLTRTRGLIAVRALQSQAASLSEVARYLHRSASALARSAERHRQDVEPG